MLQFILFNMNNNQIPILLSRNSLKLKYLSKYLHLDHKINWTKINARYRYKPIVV